MSMSHSILLEFILIISLTFYCIVRTCSYDKKLQQNKNGNNKEYSEKMSMSHSLRLEFILYYITLTLYYIANNTFTCQKFTA